MSLEELVEELAFALLNTDHHTNTAGKFNLTAHSLGNVVEFTVTQKNETGDDISEHTIHAVFKPGPFRYPA